MCLVFGWVSFKKWHKRFFFVYFEMMRMSPKSLEKNSTFPVFSIMLSLSFNNYSSSSTCVIIITWRHNNNNLILMHLFMHGWFSTALAHQPLSQRNSNHPSFVPNKTVRWKSVVLVPCIFLLENDNKWHANANIQQASLGLGDKKFFLCML